MGMRVLQRYTLLLAAALLLLCGGCGGELGSALGQRDPLLRLPHDLLWATGVSDYLLGRWGPAARELERSLLGRSALRQLRGECSEHCDPGSTPAREPPSLGHPLLPTPGPLLSSDPLSQLAFFGRVLHRADCLRRCLEAGLGGEPSRHRVTGEVDAAFRSRAPYNYLQLCYYQIGQLDKAVAAAQTFLAANPDHEEMQENVEKYRRMEGVKAEDFRDLEEQPHWVSYDLGSRLLQGEQFVESAQQLEQSVGQFLAALDQCRAQCGGPHQFSDYSYLEYQSHLFEAVADHLLQVLHCNQECVREVGTRLGPTQALTDLLTSALRLLQYAHHRAGNYELAVEYSRTFLLFWPQDHAMLQNLDFFRSRLGEEGTARVGVREDIRLYLERSLLEKQLLYLAEEGQMDQGFQDPDSWTPAEIIPESVRKKQRTEEEKPQISAPRNQKSAPNNQMSQPAADPRRGLDVLKASWPGLGGLLVAEETGLKGPEEMVLDGALSHSECERMRDLANTAEELSQWSGDGRSAPPLPVGLDLLQVLKLSRAGKVRRDVAQLYLQVTKRCRSVIEHLFQLPGPLHLSFSHLSCRSVSAGNEATPTSRSCLEEPEGSECSRQGSAGGARNFSVHLYLNDEFEGGNLLFMDLNTQNVTVEVTPRCGRLLTFRWGDGTSHGVGGVTRGQRCALVLWYTLDPRHNEKGRSQIDALTQELFPDPMPVDRSHEPDKGLPRPAEEELSAGGRRQTQRERRRAEPVVAGRPGKDEL